MMIQSLLDNDLYKFTMQWAVMKLYPNTRVQYEFINRGEDKFTEDMVEQITQEIRDLCRVRLLPEEYEYLKSIPFLPPVYADLMRGYSFDMSEILIVGMPNGDLKVEITGPWYRTILWEVPLMAIISEVYCSTLQRDNTIDITGRMLRKAKFFHENKIKIAELGTRRRYSLETQKDIVKTLSHNCDSFVGTSNVMLAMKQRITPIGTQAHEWFMFHGAKYGYRAANKIALERWTNVYDGDLGIALSDTYTSKIFFEQFSKLHAKLFDGVRHDSGDPIEFTRRAIKFYKEVGINPATKNIIFSDGLNIDKVLKIEQQIKDWPIMRSYGIGTNLTNDIGVKPLNIVVKMVRCTTDKWNNWWETIKLSDIPGKHTGEITEIHRCKKELEIL